MVLGCLAKQDPCHCASLSAEHWLVGTIADSYRRAFDDSVGHVYTIVWEFMEPQGPSILP